MRKGILISYDAKGDPNVIAGPNSEIHKLKQQFRDLHEKMVDGNDKIAILEFWDSGSGVTKRRKCLTSEQVAANKAAQKREQDRLKELEAEKAKAQKDDATDKTAKPKAKTAKPKAKTDDSQ